MITEIYTEYTPNPESLKFVSNKMLLPNQVLDFKSKSATDDAPLAKALFEKFDFVEGVFISNNFITITKKSNLEWIELVPEVKSFIKNYIESNAVIAKITTKNTLDTEENLNDIEIKIINILDTYVKPAVEMDGGNIRFKSYSNGIVTVKMQGSCSGCPSSTLTLKSGIEGLLKRMVPEVNEVVAEAE